MNGSKISSPILQLLHLPTILDSLDFSQSTFGHILQVHYSDVTNGDELKHLGQRRVVLKGDLLLVQNSNSNLSNGHL